MLEAGMTSAATAGGLAVRVVSVFLPLLLDDHPSRLYSVLEDGVSAAAVGELGGMLEAGTASSAAAGGLAVHVVSVFLPLPPDDHPRKRYSVLVVGVATEVEGD
jgi:hypothetical protein